MYIQINITSLSELIAMVGEEEPTKAVTVRGHFRVVNGKKVYVKTYLRKR